VVPARHQGGPDLDAAPAPARPSGTALPRPALLPPPAAAEPESTTLPTPRRVERPAPRAASPRDAALIGAARAAVKQGNYADAVPRFEEYLTRFPDDDAIRREYAGVLVQADRTAQAIGQYQQLLARKPDDAELLVLLGDLYVRTRQYKQAAGLYAQALRLTPERVDTAARLARALALNREYCRALEVYDRHLAALSAGDERVTRTVPSLLLDLGLYGQALAFLRPLLEKSPRDLELLALQLRAYARLDRAQALRLIEDMAGRPNPSARLELAGTLYGSEEYDLAGAVYQQILQAEPANENALIGSARVLLKQFQPLQARAVLECFTPTAAAQRSYRLAQAEYYQAVGEYIEAKHVYRDFLHRNPADHAARLALAQLYEFIRENEKAKAEYAKVPPDAAESRDARIGLASTLAASRHFPEAVEAYHKVLADNASDPDAMAGLVRTLARAGDCGKAVAVGRGFIQANGRLDLAVIPVRFALGLVLLDAGRASEAAHEYTWLLARPGGQVPESYYGMARALHKLGDGPRVVQTLAGVATLPGGFARNRVLLADLFYRDNEDAAAVEMLHPVLAAEPHTLSALIRLADAQLRLARPTARIDDVVHTAKTILAASPTNVRGHLALARALATVQDYKASAAEYERLIAFDPDFRVPQRERARVLYSDHQYAAAAAAYHALEGTAAEAVFGNDLAACAAANAHAAPLLEPYLHGGIPGATLQAEVSRVATASGDAALAANLGGLAADYQARSVEQQEAHLEGEAKSLKGWRNYAAVPVYKSLIDVEPDNEEALFDLGQVYGDLRQTRNALPVFGEVLAVEPQHREAQIASERAGLELQPWLHPDVVYFRQRGFNGTAQIDRLAYGGALGVPFGDENEWLGLAFHRVRYAPPDDRPLDGNIVSAHAQVKCCDERLLLYGQLNGEFFPDRLHNRPTYDAGAVYDYSDFLHLRARGFLENVVENGESLRQDIYRTGFDLAADLRPTRYWDMSGVYRFAYYSDVNHATELYFTTGYSLTLPPRQLKFVLSTDYLTFAKQTIFATPQQNTAVGAVHPYFAPSGYFYYQGRIEWYDWLSRDYSVFSNQIWYSLQYGLGFDQADNAYNDFRAILNADVKSWLSVGVQGQALMSGVYRAQSVLAYVAIRWPCCSH
jgi:tetratricopeptide (TPR) repeat protein